MLRKTFRLMIVVVLVSSLTFTSAQAASQNSSPQTDAQLEKVQLTKIREAVARLGEGPEARVEVKLRDKTKLKGYIRESGEDYFIVREKDTVNNRRIEYSEVADIKAPKRMTVSPFVIRLALVAVPIIVTTAILASRTSDRPRTITIAGTN